MYQWFPVGVKYVKESPFQIVLSENGNSDLKLISNLYDPPYYIVVRTRIILAALLAISVAEQLTIYLLWINDYS